MPNSKLPVKQTMVNKPSNAITIVICSAWLIQFIVNLIFFFYLAFAVSSVMAIADALQKHVDRDAKEREKFETAVEKFNRARKVAGDTNGQD